VVSEFDSQLKGLGFESYAIPDGNGFKTMQGSIAVLNLGMSSNENKDNIQKGNTN